MHKERFYIGVSIIVAITVATYVAAFVVSERQKQKNMTTLRSRVAEIEARYRQQNRPATSAAVQEEMPEPHTQVEESAPVCAEDILAAFERFSEMMHAAGGDMHKYLSKRWNELSDNERENITAFLAENQELILELRRLAETGGPFHDLDLSKGFEMELPHLSKLRVSGRLLAANMIVAAARDDYESVTKDAVAIMRLADAVGREPIIISQLVRIAMYQRLYECVAQSLRIEDMPPNLFAQIVNHVSVNHGRDMLADALAFEASWGITEAFDTVRRGTGSYSNSFVMQLYGSVGRPLLNRDEDIFVGLMKRASDAMRLPYYQAQPVLEQIRGEAENLPYIRLISRPLLNILIPVHINHPEEMARNEAQLGLMQVGLAIERYHAQHGTYPVALETVAPVLGGALPLDPYTGQPFVYEPCRNGFTLYSARAQGNIVWRGAEE